MNLFKPSYIIIHHSLTVDSRTVSWQAIRNYHLSLGWDDIGYHYGIEMVNNKYEILVGRMEGTPGAHCREENINRKSIGICCVGNFDDEAPDMAQWNILIDLCVNICLRYEITIKNIKGHKEYAPYKSCPGKKFNMDEFRKDLKNLF